MRSIAGTITHYVADQDQVEELDLGPLEVRALRRRKAEAHFLAKQAEADQARAVVASYDADHA